MNSPGKSLVAAIIVTSLVVWFIIIARHRSRNVELAHSELRVAAPVIYEKLAKEVTDLKLETVAQSIEKLSDVNMFYWPGAKIPSIIMAKEWIPLADDVGQFDLDAIMSNRRFRKVLDELRKMDKAAAAEIVNAQLSSAISKYLPLYDAEMRRFTPHYKREKIQGQRGYSGPGFATGNVPEGEITIAGTRLEILSLVMASGLLDLTKCLDQIKIVAQVAVKQRSELYNDLTLDPFFKAEMLKLASLYNRQIICSGLVDLSADPHVEAFILNTIGAQWQQRDLVSFEAVLTEFDLPVRSGGLRPDTSRGSTQVRFLSPLDDADFDRVLRELHVTP